MDLASYIDHTLLRANATRDDILRLCEEARRHGFASVCVNPFWVPTAAAALRGSGVAVCSVVGFPLGATMDKAAEARQAVRDGADEVDFVLNVGCLKSGDDFWSDEFAAMREAVPTTVVKVILETCLLTDEEIVRVCKAATKYGLDFVKTSTGFGEGGATVDHVRLMRATVGNLCGVKASGGIHDRATAVAMIEAGATRLGTSHGAAIVSGASAGEGGY